MVRNAFRDPRTWIVPVLIIFYLVGSVGLQLSAYREHFLPLSGLNLLLTFVLLLLSYREEHLKRMVFLAVCFLVGFGAEYIGVHTGWLFGTYWYGANLGTKLAEIPLIIGVNWGILTLCSVSVTSYFFPALKAKAFVSSALMLLLDVLIEPVAITSDYWQWEGDTIPIYNYVCWYVIALPLHALYFRLSFRENTFTARALYVILALFFLLQLL